MPSISYLSRFDTVPEPMQPKRNRLSMVPIGMIGVDKKNLGLYGIGSHLLDADAVPIR